VLSKSEKLKFIQRLTNKLGYFFIVLNRDPWALWRAGKWRWLQCVDR